MSTSHQLKATWMIALTVCSILITLLGYAVKSNTPRPTIASTHHSLVPQLQDRYTENELSSESTLTDKTTIHSTTTYANQSGLLTQVYRQLKEAPNSTTSQTKLPTQAIPNSTTRPTTQAVQKLLQSEPDSTMTPLDSCATATSSSYTSWEGKQVTHYQPTITAHCPALRQHGTGNEAQIIKAQLKQWRNNETNDQWLKRMQNCSAVVAEFSNNFYVSREELDFPLAFTFVAHTNARQVVRLLKAIYRPHNLYCIHPDKRQGEDFIKPFQQLSNCLNNVILASTILQVYYAHHSLLDAQLQCLSDLQRHNTTKWKYAINVSGRELPLLSNREIVQSLKELNGSSALGDAHPIPQHWLRERFTYKYTLSMHGRMVKTPSRLGKPPLPIYKSLTFVAVSRQFAAFMLTDPIATELRTFLNDVYAPEEHFYATLYFSAKAPGGRPDMDYTVVPVVNQVIWMLKRWVGHNPSLFCKGPTVHAACILTVGDLRAVYKLGLDAERKYYFFNKYFGENDHVVMDCMEKRLVEQNMLEYNNDCHTHYS